MTNTSVSYYDAFISEKNTIAFFSKLDAAPHDDYTHARMYSWMQGTWGHRDIPFMVNSAILTRPAGGNPKYLIHSLGRMSGIVEVYWPMDTKREYEFLPGTTLDRGLLHLQQIKEIAGRLYVVGPSSQIFRRKLSESTGLIQFPGAKGQIFSGRMEQWEIFNQGVEKVSLKDFENKGMSRGDALTAAVDYCSLNSIDGSNDNDLYAVGSAGVIIHRGKGPWEFIPKVTNVELRRVRQIDTRTVYIVGDRGILLKGNVQDGFQIIPTNISEDIWGLEWFNGKLYLGVKNRGLFVFDGQSVAKVPVLPNFTCHTLHAKDGQLLAVGDKDAYLTDDATTWKLLQNPNNV